MNARTWFMNETGTELIQIQNDHFAHNWRRHGGQLGGDAEYPRYAYLRESFEENLTVFEQFLASEKLGPLVFNQCELTYLNEILIPHSEIADVITVLNPLTGSSLPAPENIGLSLRYVIPDERGAPVGRLHVELKPAFRRAGKGESLVMTLTARGRPLGQGIGGVLHFLDVGHDWTLRAFVDLTSESMQVRWGKHVGS